MQTQLPRASMVNMLIVKGMVNFFKLLMDKVKITVLTLHRFYQILFGLGVTKEKIIVIGDVNGGNTSDKNRILKLASFDDSIYSNTNVIV